MSVKINVIELKESKRKRTNKNEVRYFWAVVGAVFGEHSRFSRVDLDQQRQYPSDGMRIFFC